MLMNDLPTGAIALWHTLMSINNMAGWKERFNAPNSTVEKLTGLSKQGLVDARRKLIENDLIEYQKGTRTKAPIYKMKSLVKNTDEKLDQSLDLKTYPNGYQSHTNDLTIPKLNNTKESSSSSAREEDVFQFYQQNIQNGVASSPFVLQNIQQWINDMSADLVLAAMKVAATKEKRGFDYTEGILKKWAQAGVKTLDDARRHELEYQGRRKSNVVEYRQPTGRYVPRDFEFDITAGEDWR